MKVISKSIDNYTSKASADDQVKKLGPERKYFIEIPDDSYNIFMSSKKIIVTGGAGLIGTEVCRQLVEQGHDVNLLDLGEQIARVGKNLPKGVHVYYGSIVDLASLRNAFEGREILIHLAAQLGVHRTERDKLKCIEMNVDGTRNVLDCAMLHGINKVVFASSSEVYGEPLENPISESTMTQGKTVYAITKLAGEELCKAYYQKYGLTYTILRYFNCYGPYQTAQFVISRFIKNVLNDKPPVVFGNGRQIRSYTYVSDTARATALAALNLNADNEIINIGHGEEPVSILDLAKMVIKMGGKEDKLEPEIRSNYDDCDREMGREIYERYCYSERIQKILNWTPQVTLEEGIRKVFDIGVIYDTWVNDEDLANII